MKFSVLGGGVVGRCYAQALVAQGHELLGLLDIQPTPALQTWAQEQGVAVHPSCADWLRPSEVVISAVFGTVALDVASEAFAFMAPDALYIDMTTADPGDMRTAARRAAAGGQYFVDVSITGSVDLSGIRTPLLCSGPAAAQVQALFAACGAPIRMAGKLAGDASSLKLLRSIFTKGMEALAVECLVTAERKGLRSDLHAVLTDIDEGSLQALMESMVRTHIAHAGRRRNEVVEAQRQMRLEGVEPVVMPAVQQLFEHTMEAARDHPFTGSSTSEALAWLSQRHPAPPGPSTDTPTPL